MPDNLKPFQLYSFLITDTRFLLCNRDLVFHRVHAFQVRKQQAAPVSLCYYYAVALHIQLIRRIYLFHAPQYIHADCQLIQLIRRDGANLGSLAAALTALWMISSAMEGCTA